MLTTAEFVDEPVPCEDFGAAYAVGAGRAFVHVELLDTDEVSVTTPAEFEIDVVARDEPTVADIDFPPTRS